MPKPLPWDAGVLWIGVDPAQLRAGLAWRAINTEHGRWELGTTVVGDILDAAKAEATLRRVAERSTFTVVRAAVEYPHWNAGASPQVRAAANAYVRLLKKVFGTKLKHVRVDPNDWQGRFIGTDNKPLVPGVDTKARAVFVAGRVYGYPLEGSDKERADAACILEYLRLNPEAAAAATKTRTDRNKKQNVCPQLQAILNQSKAPKKKRP